MFSYHHHFGHVPDRAGTGHFCHCCPCSPCSLHSVSDSLWFQSENVLPLWADEHMRRWANLGCIHIPPKRGKYWEINSPQPRDFLRPKSLRKISRVEKNLEGRRNGFPNTSWYLVDYIHSVIINQNRSMWPKKIFSMSFEKDWEYENIITLGRGCTSIKKNY